MNNLLNQNLILRGKKVLLRVDLNVPMKNGAITETSRIEKILPTIKLLIEKKAKIIILSHIGRPKGKVVSEMSLEPISKKLSQYLNKEVLFNKNKINENTISEINKVSNGSIMMLENIRFNEGEETNDKEFSKKISTLGDIYVNDAFSCSHRAHASIDGITKYLPSYFGLQITEEINALKKITSGYNSFSAGGIRETLNLGSNFDEKLILPLICYEIIYPGKIKTKNQSPDLAINISEDAWFGQSIGPYQHFSKAIYRSVEEGIFIARSANKGISAFINPNGRVLKSLNSEESGNIELNFPNFNQPTLFSNYGNKIFFLIVLLYIFLTLIFKKLKI